MVVQGDTYDKIVEVATTTGLVGHSASAASGSAVHSHSVASIDASEAHNPTVYNSDALSIQYLRVNGSVMAGSSVCPSSLPLFVPCCLVWAVSCCVDDDSYSVSLTRTAGVVHRVQALSLIHI